MQFVNNINKTYNHLHQIAQPRRLQSTLPLLFTLTALTLLLSLLPPANNQQTPHPLAPFYSTDPVCVDVPERAALRAPGGINSIYYYTNVEII